MSAPTRKSRVLSIVLPTIVTAFAFAAPGAMAADHCVGLHPSCSGPNTYDATAAGLQSAMGAANNNVNFPGADTVYVGPGTYEVMSTATITLTAPMTIVGAGKGTTSIEAKANNVTALYAYGSGSNTVDISDLTVRNEGWSTGYGLTIGAGTAHDIDIYAIAESGTVRGAQVLLNGRLEDSNITVKGSNALGMSLSGGGTVSGVEIIGINGNETGIQASGSGTRTVVETTFRNLKKGMYSDNGPLEVRDAFFDLKAISSAVAIESENFNNCGICVLDLDARNITVVGSGANQVGVGVGAGATDGLAESGSGEVVNSYFDLTGSNAKAMRCRKSGADTTASLISNYVAAQTARIQREVGCSGSDTNLLDTTSEVIAYNLVSAGDYRPVTGSPLIDAGEPGTVVDVDRQDADGLSRIVDGDGDLGDRIDIGAYEYQSAMEPGISFTATPDTVEEGVDVEFTASVSDPDGGAVSVAWNFGDSATATGTTATHAYSSAGDFTVTATATDNEGQTRSTTRIVHVNSNPPTTPTPEANLTTAHRGQLITFTASGSTDPDGDDFTYKWSFTGGGSETGASVDRAATVLGTYTATVRAVDSNNESSPPAEVDVSIYNRAPNVPVVAKDVATGFRGDTFTFTYTATDPDGDTLNRRWNFGDGPTTDYVSNVPQPHQYSTVGVKTVTVIVGDGNDFTSGSTTVEVLDRAPVLGALTRAGGSKIGDVQTFGISATDADADPVAFSWNFGDGSTATGPSASHAYTAAGTYSVVVSANDGQGAVVVAQTSVTIDPPLVKLKKQSKKTKAGKKNPIAVNASSASVAKITLARAGAGWVKGKKCSAKRPSSKSKKRCDLALKKSLTRALPAGDSKIPFAGTWGGKKLAPGKYRVTVTPDQGGKPVSVLVTIL